MDEPTANIDAETDARVQHTFVRGQLRGVTVLTVAHRLHTIADYDVVLVMEAGRLVEQGRPHELLRRSGSYLERMSAELGPEESRALRGRAAKAGSGAAEGLGGH